MRLIKAEVFKRIQSDKGGIDCVVAIVYVLCVRAYIIYTLCIHLWLPYSRKFSRVLIFAVFVYQHASTKIRAHA